MLHWKLHVEAAPVRLVLIDPDSSAVNLGRQPAEGEPEAAAIRRLPGVHIQTRILIKDLLALVRRDSPAEVADAELDPAVLRRARGDADDAPRRRVLPSVVDEVLDQPAEQLRVGLQRRRASLQLQGTPVVHRLRDLDLLEHRRQIHARRSWAPSRRPRCG